MRAEAAGKAVVCVAHRRAGHPNLKHGYDRRTPYFRALEQATEAAMAREGRPVVAELFVMRVKVLGLLVYLGRGELTAAERARRLLTQMGEAEAGYGEMLARFAPLVLEALRTVAALMETEKGLAAQREGEIAAAIGQALDELSAEWGVEL